MLGVVVTSNVGYPDYQVTGPVTTEQYRTIQCSTVTTVQYSAVQLPQFSTVQYSYHSAVQCSTVTTVNDSAVQCSTVQYSTYLDSCHKAGALY